MTLLEYYPLSKGAPAIEMEVPADVGGDGSAAGGAVGVRCDARAVSVAGGGGGASGRLRGGVETEGAALGRRQPRGSHLSCRVIPQTHDK